MPLSCGKEVEEERGAEWSVLCLDIEGRRERWTKFKVGSVGGSTCHDKRAK